MSQPKFEVASGVVDGSNKTFTVSVPYSPNTTAVFLNGKMYRRDWDDGWFETNPALGIIDLKAAPLPGDVVQVFFTDSAASGTLEEESRPLHGVIHEVSELRGDLTEVEIRTGVIRCNC